MSLDQRAQILEATIQTPCGVRNLVTTLRWKTSRVICLLRKMNEEKLIELKQTNMRAHPRRGRPKKKIVCTPLGFEFLDTYRKLRMKPIKARKEDLEKAVKDALYTDRLVSNGHSPFKIFMELNTIVNNIKIASETPETI